MARAAAHKPSTAPSGTESLFDAPPSYELALAELDALVARMEGGQLPLDQLLGSYRRGAELLAFCRTRLEAVESQVKQLDASGALEPWVGLA